MFSHSMYFFKQIVLNIFAGKSLKNVGVIKADVSDPNSLTEMAKKGKIVLNCVGPYRFEGNTCFKSVSIIHSECLDFMEKL